MRRAVTILLLACILLGGVACQAQREAEGLRLWFPVEAQSAGQALDSEAYHGSAYATVDTLMDALLDGPKQDTLVSPFRPDTRLLGWTLENRTLRLDMSAPYGDLTGIDLTLADYCITLTLCQLSGVEQVCITVNGNPISYRNRETLTAQDVMITGAEEEPRLVSAVLYFPRAVGKGLGFELRELTLTEDDDLFETVTQIMMAGPEDEDLRTLMPEGTQLIDAWLDDGICFVNFSSAFLDQAPTDVNEQNLLLYSVVDTLGNLDAVTAVQLLVEDEVLLRYGSTATNMPLEPDFGFLNLEEKERAG